MAKKKEGENNLNDQKIYSMKIIASFVLLILFTSCDFGKIDHPKAKALVENLLYDLKAENYSSLDKYYTSSFNESEPLDQKAEKFKRLKDTMGAMKSFEFISSEEKKDADKGINQLELKYKVACEKVTVLETYLVINDEGDQKIIFQNIENFK